MKLTIFTDTDKVPNRINFQDIVYLFGFVDIVYIITKELKESHLDSTELRNKNKNIATFSYN